jgi:two-component system response regulator CpxR
LPEIEAARRTSLIPGVNQSRVFASCMNVWNPMPASDARILIVDDDRELTGLMCEYLSGQGFRVDCAHDGPAGLKAALDLRPDLVLLDVMMPGFDGFEVLTRLRARSEVPVLMLTARTEAASRIAGLEAGADDYLPKPFNPREVAARIRAILRRTAPKDSAEPVERSGIRLEPQARRVLAGGTELEVTSVEFEILDLLIRNAGRAVTRDEVAQRLYQRPATPFDRAIDVHISHIRKKLGDGLIRTVRGVGYQFSVVEA